MSGPPQGGSRSYITSPRPASSSTQFPFPQHEQPQRPGGRAQHTRRPSAASSITSVGGTLESVPTLSPSISESNNNAISTLLQPPISRTGLLPNAPAPTGFKLPSAKDIPPVSLTNIPHVDPLVFRPYLNQAGSLYDAFRRAKESDSSLHHRRPRATSKNNEVPSTNPVGPSRRQGSVSSILGSDVASPILGSPTERPHVARKGSGGQGRKAPHAVTPLSTIPSVYFEPDFHLENPRTFDIVSERAEIVRPPPGANGSAIIPGTPGRKALASNAILQEKLSWYMDTVEVHLISSISTASTSFFAALGSLRELHLEAAESVDKIKRLRGDLAELDKSMAVGGLKIVAARRRRENMHTLANAMQQLRDVVDALARCEDQVEKGHIEDALKGLAKVERLIAGERDLPMGQPHDRENVPVLFDLRGIKALERADHDIAMLRRRVGKGFEHRFLEVLLKDLRKHVDSVPSVATFQRWDKATQRSRGHHDRTPSVFPAYLQMDDGIRSTLRSNLEGLAQAGSIMPAAMAFREAALREVKALIKRPLPSSSDDDAESTMSASTQGGRQLTQQDKSSILARNLRALDSADAEDMLKQMYSNVGEALRRLGTQVKVLLDVTSSFSNRRPPSGVKSPMSPPPGVRDDYMNGPVPGITVRTPVQEDIQQALDMSNLLGQAVDIAQSQIVKILKARSEQSTHLPLSQFVRYFHLNRLFADECEAVSGRSGQALKAIVNTHIKDFVSQLGQSLMQELVQSMDKDRWEAKDCGEHDSQILNRILEASTKEIDSWTKACLVWEGGAEGSNGDVQINGETNGTATPKDKTRSATIDEQKYILTESTLLVLQSIEQFERLITGIPSMTQEITSLLLEYLKLFNSRCQQLVLGAGATKIAGLKNITTKHLALSSQALSFITALTPHIREFVRRHTSGAGQLMVEFDKVRRLYQEHQYGVHDKFVEIMSGRASAHVSVMKKINWDAPVKDSQAVNPYMETLVKETLTLHKVLSKFLPEMTISMIMDPVFNSYREQLGKGFLDAEVKTSAGKLRMIHDIEYLQSRMGKREGSAGFSQHLLSVVQNKLVAKEAEKMPSSAEPTITPGAVVEKPSEEPPKGSS
ncbi:MAG: hypothetical protein Q9199_005544 [Rusavskia elegans]